MRAAGGRHPGATRTLCRRNPGWRRPRQPALRPLNRGRRVTRPGRDACADTVCYT